MELSGIFRRNFSLLQKLFTWPQSDKGTGVPVSPWVRVLGTLEEMGEVSPGATSVHRCLCFLFLTSVQWNVPEGDGPSVAVSFVFSFLFLIFREKG